MIRKLCQSSRSSVTTLDSGSLQDAFLQGSRAHYWINPDQYAQRKWPSVFLRYAGSIFDKINERGKKRKVPFLPYKSSECFSTWVWPREVLCVFVCVCVSRPRQPWCSVLETREQSAFPLFPAAAVRSSRCFAALTAESLRRHQRANCCRAGEAGAQCAGDSVCEQCDRAGMRPSLCLTQRTNGCIRPPSRLLHWASVTFKAGRKGDLTALRVNMHCW